MRIAVGGFCRVPVPTATDTPPLRLIRGESLFDSLPELGGPLADAVAELAHRRHILVPLALGIAPDGAGLTDPIFETVAAVLVHDLASAREQGDLDGIYLDLQDLSATPRFDDAAGELLRRLRAVAGGSVRMAVNLNHSAQPGHEAIEASDMIFVDSGRGTALALDASVRACSQNP